MNCNYSIVIPHFNTPELLAKMLKSIPNRNDIQVIVVDDCSSEKSLIALKQLVHENLEIHYLDQNLGAGHARNVGLKYVKGEWVLVVDADDVFAPNTFKVLDMYKDLSTDYFCFRIMVIDSNGNPKGSNVSDKSVGAYLKKKNRNSINLFKYKNTVCWNKMVSAEFIRRKGICFEECQVNNDVLFNFMIGLYAKDFIVIPDILYYPTLINSSSITRQERSVEKEFMFYLQAQKRNGFYKKIGLWYWPFYRYDIFYILFFIKKHGICFVFKFFHYCRIHQQEIKDARTAYLSLFDNRTTDI